MKMRKDTNQNNFKYGHFLHSEILALHASNATQSEDMAAEIIKYNSDIFLNIFKKTLITLLKQELFQSNKNILM